MRALVLERRGSYAIVLLPGGRFARIRAPLAAVGEEIEMTRPAGAPVTAHLRPYGYAAAALAVLLALLPAALPHANAQVAAYATLDVNPSVQFGLSASGEVVSAQGLDADGIRVVQQSRPDGRPLSGAVSAILAAAHADGLLTQGGDASVIIATYPAGDAPSVPAAVQQQLLAARAASTAFLSAQHAQGIVTAMIVPTWLRAAAQRAKVSPGVYAVVTALRDAGIKVNIRSFRGRRLGTEIAHIAATPAGKTVLPMLTGSAPEKPVTPTGPAPSTTPSSTTHPTTTPTSGLLTGSTPPTAPTTPTTTPTVPSQGHAHGAPTPVIVLSPNGSSDILGGLSYGQGHGDQGQSGKGSDGRGGQGQGFGKGFGKGQGFGQGQGFGKGQGVGQGGDGSGQSSGKAGPQQGGSGDGSQTGGQGGSPTQYFPGGSTQIQPGSSGDGGYLQQGGTSGGSSLLPGSGDGGSTYPYQSGGGDGSGGGGD